ncbi:hypothetical protein [Taibaiella chishuiensis]|uniref:Uncharacterized protein n=1 Tax=Taibaiella chishuiensis TaxID=1434707 RepID=A0A2P8D0P0_9BACT|nr:hypothetical protein [Taibaiella chishuiensis]PSK90789.1 hypothetical protein B0I18_107201 [Taibaiella chishuiensis]
MQQLLKERLQAYITLNNPELMAELHSDFSVTNYLEDKVSKVMPIILNLLEQGKPGYIIEELSLNEMTAELKPSRFNYLQTVLETEFSEYYQQWVDLGVLTYETINLVISCKETFEAFSFSVENEDNRFMRYAIIAAIHDYLN